MHLNVGVTLSTENYPDTTSITTVVMIDGQRQTLVKHVPTPVFKSHFRVVMEGVTEEIERFMEKS